MSPIIFFPPNKKPRLDCELAVVVTPPPSVQEQHPMILDQVLDLSLQRRILSFLIDLPTQDGKSSDRQAIAETVLDCSLVCKTWRSVVRNIVNVPVVPRPSLVTASLLADIKARVVRLDLESICDTFSQNVEEKWGAVDLDGLMALDVIVEHTHGSMESFVEAAEHHYRQFLVVKCIETVVTRKNPPLSDGFGYKKRTETDIIDTKPPPRSLLNVWRAKCVPPKLLDMFWQAHILHPVKYMQDCLSIINQVVDREPVDQLEYAWEGSDFVSKRDQLFHFELAIGGTRLRNVLPQAVPSCKQKNCQVSGDDIFDLDDLSVSELGTEIINMDY